MFVTVVAIVCRILVGGHVCQEDIVTDSNLTSGLTLWDCNGGAQAPLAKWKAEHPVYRSEAYTIEGYKCVPGHYELRGRA
jgi:hypothetical protein